MAPRGFLESLRDEVDGVELPQARIVVGRGCESPAALIDIVVERNRASREHFCIEPAGEEESCKFIIRDLDSANGTFLNGKRPRLEAKRAYQLQPGDTICMGATAISQPDFRFIVLRSVDDFKEHALQSLTRKRKRQPDQRERLGDWFWKDRKFCDMRVRCEDKEFPAHRAVLAAASPVLDAMLSSGMKEDTQRLLQISDHSAGAVEAFLEYVYRGRLCDGCDAAALLALADQYEVDSLVEECAATLLRNMTADTAVQTMIAVKKYRERPRVLPLWSGMRNTFQALLETGAVLDKCIESLGA